MNDKTLRKLFSKGRTHREPQQWETKLTQSIDAGVITLNVSFKYHHTKYLLKIIHYQFVVTPIDKANNKFVFVFNRYYVKLFSKEPGICGS